MINNEITVCEYSSTIAYYLKKILRNSLFYDKDDDDLLLSLDELNLLLSNEILLIHVNIASYEYENSANLSIK